MSSSLGIVADRRFLEHRIAGATRECPERLSSILQAIDSPRYDGRLTCYQPRDLTDPELLAVHSGFYLDQIRSACVSPDPYSYDKDTYLMEDSLYVARLAAGSCLVLADAIMAGEVKRGFALVRPPGHHAETGRGMGFCIINNAAVTAQHLLDQHRLSRILVVDFDAHHGNGQQEIFYGSNQVLTLSIHQDSIYPFSGKVTELGQGDGLGYNINIPVYGQYGDLEYKHIFGRIVQAIAEQYAPQIILVSAGFDGHAEDTISGLQLTTQGYAELCEILKYLANLLCDDRLLYILEGGYHLPALEESVIASLDTLIEPCSGKPRYGFSQKTQTHIDTSLRDAIGEKWQIL